MGRYFFETITGLGALIAMAGRSAVPARQVADFRDAAPRPPANRVRTIRREPPKLSKLEALKRPKVRLR